MPSDKVPFFTQTAVLDTLMKKDDLSSSSSSVEVIAKSLKSKPELYRYFFRNRPNSIWAKELLKHDFFIKAPELGKDERGTFANRWEEQEYLISVAQEVPDVVVEHIKRIAGHNFYFSGAIAALQKIPIKLIETVIPSILEWLDDKEKAAYCSQNILSLIYVLAENRSNSAFLLFQKLTKPYPLENSSRYLNDAKSIISEDYFGEITLEKTISSLQKFDYKQTITIVQHQLCETLRIEAEIANDENYKELSYWRKAIEDSSQDTREKYKGKLLNLLRNCLEFVAENTPESLIKLIKEYLNNSHEILRRLAFHILNQFPEKFSHLVSKELLNIANLDDIGIHHEYFILLENGYLHLTNSEQNQLLNTIILGPSQQKLEGMSPWNDESEEEFEQYIERYKKSWVRDRLWMIKDYIEGEPKEFLNGLLNEIGKPNHPEFTMWMDSGGVFAVSDVSPIAADELSEKADEDLLYYLKNWKPKGNNFGSERESNSALSYEVSTLVLNNIERYSNNLIGILSVHSDFATSFISAPYPEKYNFHEVLDLRLNVCENLLADENIRTSLDETSDGRWVSFRFAIVKMCKEFFTKENLSLNTNQLNRVRNLLLILSEDPDPNLEDDRPKEGWFGHNDPLSVAINHVRSEALQSLIFYAYNVSVENSKNAISEIVRTMESDVKTFLTDKVKRQNDHSLAVHSVFGLELNRLYWIDKEWVIENLDEIFPEENNDESTAFYVAAWDCYVVNNNVNLELFEILRSKYERAIENVSKGFISKVFNPVQGLSRHLILDYQSNKFDIKSEEGQSSLIAKFFNESQPNQRGDAVWVLINRAKEHKEEWQRTKELWIWRLEVASNANYSTEFKSEMITFSLLLSSAPESETIHTLWFLLEGFLPYLNDSESWDRIWHNLQEFLVREATKSPKEVINFYALMHDKLNKPQFYYEKEARTILEIGASNEISKKATLMLIDKIHRIGNADFQDIQNQLLAEIG